MAFSALSSATSRIGDLLADEAKFLWGVEEQVDRLQTELRWMQSFLSLKDADARQGEDERIRMWVAEIRELAYDAEDVVEAFALKVGSRRKGGFSNVIKRSACILNQAWLLHKTRSKIESIIARITDLTRRLQTYGIKELRDAQASSSSNVRRELRWSYPHVVDDNIVGLGHVTEKLVSILVVANNDYQFVAICGMGGLGKTTLAKKVYNHIQVRDNFTYLAWVYVSQQCQKRKVWEDILAGFNIMNREVRKMTDAAVADKLVKFLKDNKCLVILDDIWSTQDWNVISHGFPPKEAPSNSKILITSRNKELASQVGARCYLHELEFLNQQESMELFQKIAFQNRTSPDAEMVDLGNRMVENCKGLPLAIIVLGGILATRDSSREWKIVSENVMPYLRRDRRQLTEDVLGLSYDDLPPYLRPCFLYLSHFPKDYEIPADRLIQLWVAEGIVSWKQDEGNEEEILEDVAERYLTQLVERCMVQVVTRDELSKIKTCRMHDLMRDLCLSKAKQENFLHIIYRGNEEQYGDRDANFSSSIISRARRIAKHEFLRIECIRNSHLRSLYLFFGNFYDEEAIDRFLTPTMLKYLEEHRRQYWNPMMWVLALLVLFKLRRIWTNVFYNFKLLRVLAFEGEYGYMGRKLPSDIGHLIHLRFLCLKGLKFDTPNLPTSLGNLRRLQTLDLRVHDDPPVHVPDVIWRLRQLKHLYLPMKCNNKTKLKLDALSNLQTLVNFNSKNCYLGLKKIRRHFSIPGSKKNWDNVNSFIKSKYLRSLFAIGERIESKDLTNLLLSCGSICALSLDAKIGKLPDSHQFSSTIAYIYLGKSGLEEDPMPTLEKLPDLRILKLHDGAFTGKKMVCSAQGFPKLDSLSLHWLDNLEELEVNEGAMPNLRQLEIEGCQKLKMMDSNGLRFITNLQDLKIKSMPKAFKDKMVEWKEEKK